MRVLLQFWPGVFRVLTVMVDRKQRDSSKGPRAARHWPKVL
jgi:hypothetical protein